MNVRTCWVDKNSALVDMYTNVLYILFQMINIVHILKVNTCSPTGTSTGSSLSSKSDAVGNPPMPPSGNTATQQGLIKK